MKISLRCIFLIALIALILTIVNFTLGIFFQIRSEYMTAQVLRNIQLYLKQNDGRWPKSPRDIGSEQYDLSYVHVNYDITAEELIKNPKFMKTSITTYSGKFYVYPHYESDLNELLETIKETNKN